MVKFMLSLVLVFGSGFSLLGLAEETADAGGKKGSQEVYSSNAGSEKKSPDKLNAEPNDVNDLDEVFVSGPNALNAAHAMGEFRGCKYVSAGLAELNPKDCPLNATNPLDKTKLITFPVKKDLGGGSNAKPENEHQ